MDTNMKSNVQRLRASLRRSVSASMMACLLAASLSAIHHARPAAASPAASNTAGPASPMACTPIGFGQTVGDSIASAAEVDCFTFDGVSSDRIRVRVVRTSGSLGPFIEIIRPDGTSLCGTVVGELSCTLDANGTHKVLVRDFSGPNTGSYRLYVQRLNNPVGCTALTYGAPPVLGMIELAADVNCFTAPGARDDRLRARVVRTSGNVGPFIEVVRPNGDHLCGTVVGELTCKLDANGTHTILVEDFGGPNTGSYRLYVQRLNNTVGCKAIVFDAAPTAGAIDLPAEVDCFTFNGAAGNRVRATVVRTGGSLGPFLEITRPNGDHLCGTVVGQLTCELDANGMHTLLVSDFGGPNTGSYQISLLCLSATCGFAQAVPIISEVRPNHGRADLPNDINIYGSNFAGGATARLGTTALATTFISATHLHATVPAGLTPGVYSLSVTNPDSQQGTLANAYTVLDVAAASDDLFGYGYELWVGPAAPFAGGAAQVGLTVHREGGKQPLSNVAVRFYLGDCASGAPLGDGAIPLLSPRSADTTSGVAWTPASPGSYTLCAHIDPGNAVSEAIENNNVVTRTVTALAQPQDQLAPHVDSFAINDGAPATTSRDVTLDASASDPSPSSGLASLLFVEWEWSQGANLWVPARSSGWLPYATASANTPWLLLPSPGMKYLQAWAADGAGNVSLFPFKAFINYVPAGDSVAQGQTRVYRYTLDAGRRLTARVESGSGDADLFVWAPDHATRPPWVSNLSSGPDEVSFVAPVAGVYQVEVYGYTAASYRVVVDVTPAADASAMSEQAIARTGGVDPNKPQPGQPIVSLASTPGAQLALPAPPSNPRHHYVYLPLVFNPPGHWNCICPPGSGCMCQPQLTPPCLPPFPGYVGCPPGYSLSSS